MSTSFCCTDCSNCSIKSVVLRLYRLMFFASRCMMISEMTNSKRTNPIKPPICINDFLRMAVISLSLFCKSDCTFFSIWQINPCSCLLSSALRAARLSACSDNRRLCAFCSLTMFLLDERSVVVVVVGFVPSFLPKMLKKPFRFGFWTVPAHFSAQ